MLLKKTLSILVALSVLLPTMSVFALSLEVSALSAMLMVAETGEVLYEKDAYAVRSMASTTKIMTALLALEEGTPGRKIEITSAMTSVEGTSAGLKPGYVVTLQSLVYAMLLESGNDAANAVALGLSGSAEEFAARMNEKAALLGMKSTNFVTPSGLDAEGHCTTAYDMALLAAHAVSRPDFVAICSASSATVKVVKPEITLTYTNHNRLLYSFDGTIGVKTGFTKKSGRCLVSAARRNGVTLVAVTLNAGDDWNDHIRMLRQGFEGVKTYRLYSGNGVSIPVVGSGGQTVEAVVCEPYYPALSQPQNVECRFYLEKFEYAPVAKGAVLGEVRFFSNGKLLHVSALTAKQSVPAAEILRQEKNKRRFRLFSSH